MIRRCDVDEACVSQWPRIEVSKCFSIKFTGRLCFLVIADIIPLKYQRCDCLNMGWTRRTPTDMPHWTLKGYKNLNITQKNTEMRKLKARELAFSREEHANCLSIAKWSSLKAWIQLILYKLNKLYLEICVCLCVKYI